MNLRHFSAVCATACVFAFVTTLSAQDRDQEDFTSELRRLRLSYRDEMVKVVDIMQSRNTGGVVDVDGLFKSQLALAEAEVAVAASPAEKIAAFQSSVAVLKKFEEYQEMRVKMGAGPSDELSKCTAARMYAEIKLLEERERQSQTKGPSGSIVDSVELFSKENLHAGQRTVSTNSCAVLALDRCRCAARSRGVRDSCPSRTSSRNVLSMP